MYAVVARFNLLRVFLAGLLLFEGWPLASALAQAEETSIENVRFEISADLIRIYYDLNAPIDKVHAVRLILRRENDASFTYRPLNITGDAGTIVFPGQKRRVVWEFTKEFPDGLSGDDFYFVVEAEYVEPERMSPWIWIGGGVLVAGIVTLIALPGAEDPPIPPVTGFPVPPGRP
jgi:hypothetical protein